MDFHLIGYNFVNLDYNSIEEKCLYLMEAVDHFKFMLADFNQVFNHY